MTDNTSWTFQGLKRWEISVILETTTPLHIGNGEMLDVADSSVEQAENIKTFIKDYKGKPIIPGSSIKGKLYHFLSNQADFKVEITTLIKQIFGEDSKEENQGRGGRAVFFDAILTDQREEALSKAYKEKLSNLPHWNAETHTYLEASTAINRHTLTATDSSLHYTECVPTGSQFELKVTGDMADEELELLLSTLNALASQKIALGADDSNGKGLMTQVYPISVKCLDHDVIKAWLNSGKSSDSMAIKSMKLLDDSEVKLKQTKYDFTTQPENGTFDVILQFNSPFIVTDPSKTGKENGAEHQVMKALTDAQGNPVLPAKSIRGALRSQAERIIRTMGGSCCDTENPCKDAHEHCIACDLFGSTGWKSTLDMSDFKYFSDTSSKAATETQQFVAIDRFHGGGKDSALFSTEYFPSPILKGKISLNLRTGANNKIDFAWRKGLLGLLFKDLSENDIRLGFGKNKGYGKLSNVTITPTSKVEICETDLQAFREKIKNTQVNYSCDNPQKVEKVDKSKLVTNATKPAEAGKFHNPYHFIPLLKPTTYAWVDVDREHKRAIKDTSHHSHAFYRQKTDQGEPLYHGRIKCCLSTETPLFIGKGEIPDSKTEENQAPQIENYRLNGELAIPATSLKGMISSIVEAASNSAMRELETEMVMSYRKKADPGEALSNFGFIIKEEETGKLKLIPASQLGAEKPPLFLKDAYTKESMKQFIESKNSWSSGSSSEEVYYIDKNDVVSKNYRSWIEEPPKQLQSERLIPGVLRILGKTGEREEAMPNKKHEWFIPIPKDATDDLGKYLASQTSRAKTISPQAITKFNQLVDQRIKSQKAKRKGEKLNAENALPYMPKGDTRALDGKVRLRHGDIVYFKEENNIVSEVSFSAIWRDTVNTPLKSFIPNELLPFNPKRDRISPAELLFGFIEKDDSKAENNELKNALAFAGKVRINTAQLSKSFKNKADSELLLNEVMLKELSSPKPPSPALYFKKKDGKNSYFSKSELNSQKNIVQGRKVYLHALKTNTGEVQKLTTNGMIGSNKNAKYPWETQHADDTGAQKRKVRIKPIKPSISFDFDIEFNNLTEWELGLLCYSLRPEDSFRHKLGMGKPIGLGSIRIDIQKLQLIDRKKRYEEDTLQSERYNLTNEVSIQQSIETFRETIEADIYQAIKLLGNPDNVHNPVHYPQVKDQDIEDKSYQWFVANDNGSGAGKLKAEQKVLEDLHSQTSNLPTLQRYKWND